MKAKGLKRGIVWTLCFTLLPQQGVALAAEQIADFMKPDRDVMVRWLPEEDSILTGEEGVIVLEAGIDPSRDIVTAADVEIRLSQAEAGALKAFRDGDGRLDISEPLISEEGGVPIWLEFTDTEEDGQEEAILSFTLDEDSPSLRQEFIFQIPVSTTELFDIDVTQEDIQVTPYLLSEEERLEKELLLEKKEKEDKKEKKEKEEKPQKSDPAGENAQESVAEEGAADTEGEGENLPSGEDVQGGESGESSENLPGEDSDSGYKGEESGQDAPPAQEAGDPGAPEVGGSGEGSGEESDDEEEGEGADAPEDEAQDSDPGSGAGSGGGTDSADSGSGGTDSADSGSSGAGSSGTDGGSTDGGSSGGSGSSSTDSAGSGNSSADSGSGSTLAKASVQAYGLSIAAKSWPRLGVSLWDGRSLLAGSARSPKEGSGAASAPRQEDGEESASGQDGGFQDSGSGDAEEDTEEGEKEYEEAGEGGLTEAGGEPEAPGAESENGDKGEENKGEEGRQDGDNTAESPEEDTQEESETDKEDAGKTSPEEETAQGEALGGAGGQETDDPGLAGGQAADEQDLPAAGGPEGRPATPSQAEEEASQGSGAEETATPSQAGQETASPSQPERENASPSQVKVLTEASPSQIRTNPYSGIVMEIETAPMHITADFGWEMEVEGDPASGEAGEEARADSAKNGSSGTEAGDFSFHIRARSQNRQETGVVYTQSQAFSFDLALPEGLKMPQDTPFFDQNAHTISIGEMPIAVLEGLPEDGIVENLRAEEEHITFTMRRTEEDAMTRPDVPVETVFEGTDLEAAAPARDMDDVGCTLTVYREALVQLALNTEKEAPKQRENEGEKKEPMDLNLRVSLQSVPRAGERALTSQAGEAKLAVTGIMPLLEQEETVTITKKTDYSQKIYWIDNNDEKEKRPDTGEYLQDYAPELKFTLTDLDTGEAQGPFILNEENWKKNFGEENPYPQTNLTPDYVYSLTGLPTEMILHNNIYNEDTTYRITWAAGETAQEAPVDAKPQNVAGYALIQIKEGGEDGYAPGWYYVLTTDFTFDIKVYEGVLGDAWEKLPDTILTEIYEQFYFVAESDDPINLSMMDLKDGAIPGANIAFEAETDESDRTLGHISLNGLWKYNLDGSLISYYVKEKDGGGEEADGRLTVESELPAGDYFAISYNNSGAPNFSSDTECVHSGGTVNLTLTGTTDYKAEKVWLDAGNAGTRPGGSFQLWRYRKGESYQTADAVRDENGAIITIELNTASSSQAVERRDLPKYDAEGYEYVYVVREYLTPGAGDDSYTQVFGAVKEENGSIVTEDTLEDEGDTRDPGNDFLYSGGTLSNRITETVHTEAAKHWNAAAYQSSLGEVTVELTLMSRPVSQEGSGEEEDWTEIRQDGVSPQYLSGFTAEELNTKTAAADMPKYDELGRELEYKWVETGVYQDEKRETNLLEETSFVLTHNGQEILYTSEAEDPVWNEETGRWQTTITNTARDTISYQLEKQWLDEEGNPDDSWAKPVRIHLYALPSGTSLTEQSLTENRVATIVLDGQPDEEEQEAGTIDGILVRVQEKDPWKAVFEDLPRMDADGRQYEYLILEENGHPEYRIDYDETTGNYSAQVINRKGSGNRILVRKEWVDGNDVLHREPVTVQAYARETNEPVGSPLVLGDDGIWQDLLYYQEDYEPDEIYVLETEVGGSKVPLSRESEEKADCPDFYNPDAPQTNVTALQFETGNHKYEVTYQAGMEFGADTLYTIRNRRLGTVNLDVTKKWVDGDGSQRKKIQAIVNKYEEEGEITLKPVFSLEFADRQSGYAITREQTDGVFGPDTVTVGYLPVEIRGENGEDRAASWQEISLEAGEESKAYFYNLPKYDGDGEIVRYEIEEKWIEIKENADGETKANSLTDEEMAERYKELYDLVSEYTNTYTVEDYEVGDKHSYDHQSAVLTNKLTGTKDVYWHKQWQDAHNFDESLRPDIYLDVYARKFAGTDGTGEPEPYCEKVRTNYRWTTESDEEGETPCNKYNTNYHWHAYLPDMPKYDDLGYEIVYYAVEKSQVNAGSFDYQDVEYAVDSEAGEGGESPGNGTVIIGNQDGFIDGKDQEYAGSLAPVVSSEDEEIYGLAEQGTFNNKISSEVTVRAQKLWEGLPSAFDKEGQLPEVTFELLRRTGGGALEEEPAAWITVGSGDWEALKEANGSYQFTIQYMGENRIEIEEGSAVFEGPPDMDKEKWEPLPRYDEEGNLYTYVLREAGVKWPNGGGEETSPDLDDVSPSLDDVYSTTITSYTARNVYSSVKGALAVKKYLRLPLGEDGTPLAYPAVRFQISRRYQTGTDPSGDPAYTDWETLDNTLTWSSDEVENAYGEATDSGTPDSENALLEKKLVFENLDIYAPNGAPFQYKVTEIRDGFLEGYKTWAAAGERAASDFSTDEESPQDQEGNISVEIPMGEGGGTALTLNTQGGRGGTAETVDVNASFLNEVDSRQTELTIQGTKIWEDLQDTFKIRPDKQTFKSWLKLSRYANAQDGQGNAISEEPVDSREYQLEITQDQGDSSQWTYTITASPSNASPSQLTKYAPNGMPWIYVMEEKVPEETPYQVSPLKQGETNQGRVTESAEEAEEGQGGQVLTLPPLTNSILIDPPFSKTWVDEEGAIIERDYLGTKLSVTFTLQVAELGEGGLVTGKWKDADEYLKAKLSEAAYEAVKSANSDLSGTGETGSFPNITLTGRINDSSVWGEDVTHNFHSMPSIIIEKSDSSGSGKQIKLAYRVVETGISYGSSSISITVEDQDNKERYTYNMDENPMFSPVYWPEGRTETDGTVKEEETFNHYTTEDLYNRLHTTEFTVEKVWKNDQGNRYNTRPGTNRDGYTWETSFVIQQRAEDSNEDWTNVTVYDENGYSAGSLVVTVYGTDKETRKEKVIGGLPTANQEGKQLEYRALELTPKTGENWWPEEGFVTVTEEERIGNGENYHTAYTASYSNAVRPASDSQAAHTQAVNTMNTRDITAKKEWIGGKSDGQSVTLELQYLDEDETTWNSFGPPAKVTLDGEADTGFNDEPHGESGEWEAVWHGVPVAMPGSCIDGEGKTKYRIVEEEGNGFIQIETDDSSLASPSTARPDVTFTNAVKTSLTVKKYWSAPEEDRKQVTVALWRTVDNINENNYNAEIVPDPSSNDSQWTKTIKPPGGGSPETVIFSPLPKYDENGNVYTYYAREIQIGEDGAEGTIEIENTDAELLSSGQGDPVRIKEETEDYIIITDIEGPETEGGAAANITAIRNIVKGEVEGEKTWKDNGNAYGTRPDTGGHGIALTLYRTTETDPGEEDWEKVPGAEPIWEDADPEDSLWTYRYENLPYADYGGNAYTYRVEETPPEIASSSTATASNAHYEQSYTNTGDYLNITNTLTEKIDIPVEKVWKDGDNVDKTRPESVTVSLKKAEGGQPVEVATASVASPGWKHTFKNVDKFDENGAFIEYTVEEADIPDGYRSELTFTQDESGKYAFTLANTLGITIPVEKIWGMLDADGKLPESVTVGLYRAAAGGDGESAGEPQPVMDENGQPVTLELNRDNGWKGSFGSGSAESGGQDNAEGGQDGAGSGGQAAFNADTFLPRFDAEGNRYLYSVREERIGDAAAEDLREQKAYIIFETNTGTDEAPGWRISNVQPVQIAGTKTWRDEGGANHTRPEALTLKLRRSTDSNARPGGGSEGSRWTYVSQEDMEREGATLTWEKGNPEKDVWIYTYANLPAADGEGNRYTYSVDEEVPEGYVLTAASPSNATPSQATPGTATPSYIPGGVDFTNLASNKALKIEGTKTWIDAGGRPADLALTLWRRVSGGEPEEAPGQAPKWQKAGNVWTFTYENLPEFDRQGRKYAYWVTESGVPSSYDVYYDEDGLHLTNVQKGGITVAKTVTGSRGSRDKEFTFTVTMLDTEIYGTMVRGTEIDGVYGGMTFVNGVASFTLKHGQSLTAEGLPGGMNYIVVEMEAGRDGYTTSSSGAMGQIPAGRTAQAAYTNSRGGGSSGGGGGNDPGGHRYVDNSGGGPGISRGGGGKTVSNKGGGGTDSTIPPIIRKDIVKTGDTSNLQRYLLLFAVSLAGLAALLFFGIFRKGGKGRKGRDK